MVPFYDNYVCELDSTSVCCCVWQACRGNQLDHGVEIADSDSPDVLPRGQRIPTEADILMAFSTVPGNYEYSLALDMQTSWHFLLSQEIISRALITPHRQISWHSQLSQVITA